MRRYILLLAALFAFGAYACGGGDDKTIDTGDGKVTISEDDLPEDFPSDFPVYDGADYKGGYEGDQGGVQGFVATWETGDSVEDVKGFYDDELKDGAWTSATSGEVADGAFWAAENTSKSLSAYVLASRAGDTTTIAVVVSNTEGDDGDDDATETSDDDDTPTADGGSGGGDLPPEVELDDDFPKDRVYVPDGARVTNNSSFTTGGAQTYFIEMYVKNEVQDVADDFEAQMKSKGWSDSFTSSQNGDIFQTYTTADTDSDGANDGVTVSITKGDVSDYVKVDMSVSLEPAE